MPEMPPLAKAFCTSLPYLVLARRVILPWALQDARLSGDVLEIGCGSGAMAAQVLKLFPEVRLTATDYDPEMVDTARRRLAPWGDRACLQQADAGHLPFEDDRFDAVLSFAMLHHVGDWQRAVAEAVRVIRLGGRLIGYDLQHVRLIPHPHRSLHAGPSPHTAPQMMSPGEFDRFLKPLPIAGVLTRRVLAGLVMRFMVTKGS